jgi:hypothetical protein
MKKRVVACIWLACAVLAGAGEEEQSFGYKDAETGLAFPKTLAGLSFIGVHRYDEPGLGYSVRYEGKNELKADIYVYDNGLPNVPTGHESALVKAESASIVRQLGMMEKRGFFRDVKSVETGAVPKEGAVRFAWQKFDLVQVGEKAKVLDEAKVTESFVTGFAGKFLKMRLTYSKAKAQDGQGVSALLAKELAALLAKAKGSPAKATKDPGKPGAGTQQPPPGAGERKE